MNVRQLRELLKKYPDDKYFYGGVYGQNISSMNWVEIKG